MLVPAPLALAIEQGGEELGGIAQLLCVLADSVSRFIVRLGQIATVLLNLVAKAIEGSAGKLSRWLIANVPCVVGC